MTEGQMLASAAAFGGGLVLLVMAGLLNKDANRRNATEDEPRPSGKSVAGIGAIGMLVIVVCVALWAIAMDAGI